MDYLSYDDKLYISILHNFVSLSKFYFLPFLCRSASADMIGRAKQCLSVLKNYEQLLFRVLMQDVLSTLSRYVFLFCFSLLFVCKVALQFRMNVL